MTSVNIDKVVEILKHVAATEVMPRFQNLQQDEIRQKNPGDFVTVADEASEKALSQALTDLLPGSIVVGEEAVSKDPSVLDRFKSDAPVWIIDPIDGTYNFAHGRSKFGILVALAQKGETTHGWVYDCPGGRMAIAEKGAGATINGEKAVMRKEARKTTDMSGMGGGAQAWHFEPISSQIKEIINVRSSLHDFLTLAAGQADFVAHASKVTPWDHSPTVLLAEEAGAYIRTVGDKMPFKPYMHKKCMLLAAADEERWDMLAEVFAPLQPK